MQIIPNITKTLLTTLLLTAASLISRAQLNPFNAMYYQNPYMYNPAMAGLSRVLTINTSYRQQWSGFPGTPKTGSLTADFQPADKVGLGLNINDDQAGLIRQTRIMGTYAYHLSLNGQNQQLHFGLSFGIDDSRVDYNNVTGDLSDTEIALYNQLKPYVDGDLGIGYTDNNLSVGAAVPNLKAAFFKSSDDRFDADRMLFITTVSYKIPMQNDDRSFMLTPLAAFRMVKSYNSIVDVGINFNLNNYGLYMQSIYHSSRSVGLGFGLDQGSYALSFNYNLETGSLTQYTQGAFEFGLKLRLLDKK
ncbi:PorP/SprF family type IX secretion system membrane protein [Mucilaginibacter sp.]|uniref:PorP/SprF family type IX secretion system membrane protein n=1 Tax=Mucilaginibacter sp. TaxID=1882438 RepID=UPI00261E8D06|nr:PorP/SprF family type IX secretion system membrane protein [Mucilaginibacter sp.]MDB4925782.1 Type secretion system rane protein PorP/SprF family [Mucilaginibacter sp.]